MSNIVIPQTDLYLMTPSADQYGIPEGRHMIPGKTYVGILPGHTRPAFVRKRPVDAGRPPLFLTQIFSSFRRTSSVETSRKPNMFCRPRSNVYYDYATAKYRPKIYVDQSPGRSITSVQQTCASCGKFRSARWQSRHPLIPGRALVPGLCGRCRDKHTSSEEERPRRRRRCRHHHQHRDYTDSTNESYNTSRESRPARRRHRSYSRDYRRRSPVRSQSGEKVRIIIANQAGDRRGTGRERTRSSSMEPIRVIHRTEVVEVPERSPRTRYVSRSSSHQEHVDSTTHYIHDFDPPPYRSRPRSMSRVSFTEDEEQIRYRSRPRSSSHVSYIEERPRRRSRPRSVSRVSHIESLRRSRSRRRARSSSQVRFFDETDYSVSHPRSGSLKRRRVVYADGPADTGESEPQAYSHALSDHHSSQGGALGDGDSDDVHIKDPSTTPPYRAPRSDNIRGAVQIEEQQFMPHDRLSSRSRQGIDPSHGTASDRTYKQPSQTRSYASESDHEATPRPAFRHVRVIQSPDEVELPSSHDSLPVNFEEARAEKRLHSPTLESREPKRQRMVSEEPQRRRRYRESDYSSSSDEDDHPQSYPIAYRHGEGPVPPMSDADLLLQLLQNATITPPSAQQERSRPAYGSYHGQSDTPSQSHHQRSYPREYREDRYDRYGGQYMTGNRPYESPSPHEPTFEGNPDYDWMT